MDYRSVLEKQIELLTKCNVVEEDGYNPEQIRKNAETICRLVETSNRFDYVPENYTHYIFTDGEEVETAK